MIRFSVQVKSFPLCSEVHDNSKLLRRDSQSSSGDHCCHSPKLEVMFWVGENKPVWVGENKPVWVGENKPVWVGENKPVWEHDAF